MFPSRIRRTMRRCSTSCSTGRRTRPSATASWSRIRQSFTASRYLAELDLPVGLLEPEIRTGYRTASRASSGPDLGEEVLDLSFEGVRLLGQLAGSGAASTHCRT